MVKYFLLCFLKGIAVGFGAILPGISGGTLCVAFGMYTPVIECLSAPRKGIAAHGKTLAVFSAGVAAGFIGLSGIAAGLLEQNSVFVTCAFIGFILGTVPSLWKDAGKEKRSVGSCLSVGLCFAVMLTLLTLLKNSPNVEIQPNFFGYLLCGVLWGLSLIVPGLSSSSLLLFFGLYAPMLDGIATLNLKVLLPLGIGLAGCVLCLSKLVGLAFCKWHSVVSHGVLGIVLATVAAIFPAPAGEFYADMANLLFIAGGIILSVFFTFLCNRAEKNALQK